jgi:hypothetical protein
VKSVTEIIASVAAAIARHDAETAQAAARAAAYTGPERRMHRRSSVSEPAAEQAPAVPAQTGETPP